MIGSKESGKPSIAPYGRKVGETEKSFFFCFVLFFFGTSVFLKFEK